MKPVLKSPARNRGCRLRAAWKARFDEMPRMTKPFSASCIRAMAWSRVAPWVMSLAIIES